MGRTSRGATRGSRDKAGAPVSIPKYTIRALLVWAVPLGALLWRNLSLIAVLLSALLTLIELPALRKQIFTSRQQKSLPCLRVPMLMRVAILWVVQVWWLLLWRAGSDAADPVNLEKGIADASDEGTLGSEAVQQKVGQKTISVVLPCAGEGEFAVNTVRSVFDTTPEEVLKEIVVVDDGSNPPLSDSHLTPHIQEKYNVKLIRHDATVGLIKTKQDGGNAATGDIIVFFDCHVAPQPGWHESFLRLIDENYRRIVVPAITDLDITTWRQRGLGGVAKCYLTWDADFKWFESDDDFVPAVSGGLLGLSKRWWSETGGYDEQMYGWGGENLDQSLRSWLCGGEIVMAKDSQVAHMWRVPHDQRTRQRYTIPSGAATKNRVRAAIAWYGPFAEKLVQFPWMQSEAKDASGAPWYGDVGNIHAVKERLQCKSFAWFLHRFKHVYEDGGLIPKRIFSLRSADLESGEPLCLTYEGGPGTSPNGVGTARLLPCDANDDRQRWHGANRDVSLPEKPCCSGLRAWNTDQCINGVNDGRATTFVCDIAGNRADQFWEVTVDGRIRAKTKSNFGSRCLAPQGMLIKEQPCRGDTGIGAWVLEHEEEPIEARLYREARERNWA